MALKVLVVGPAWVGDMVMAQSLFKLLKLNNPALELDVLAPKWSLPLLARMPEVDAAICAPFEHGQFKLGARYRFAKALRASAYDHAIVLPNSWKSALIPFFAGIPKRTGYLGELRYGLLTDRRRLNQQALPLMIQRFCGLGLNPEQPLAEKLPVPALTVDEADVSCALARHALNTAKPIIALCPGAEYGEAKRWPPQSFASIAKDQLAKGYQVWIFGSAKETAIAAAIQADCDGGCQVLAGKTTLAEAIDLLSLAQTVVCNDSGLMHIASALKRPTVAIYGSSSPSFTPPLYAKVKIVSLNLACSPCFKRVCPLEHMNCLKALTPALVLEAMDNLHP